jgi:hypothetical protein
MHRAKSLLFYSRQTSQGSEAKEKLDSKLDISDTVPYNNAKLKGSPRSRIMPCWTQAALQRLGSVLQLLLLLLAVCLWGLLLQARHQVCTEIECTCFKTFKGFGSTYKHLCYLLCVCVLKVRSTT